MRLTYLVLAALFASCSSGGAMPGPPDLAYRPSEGMSGTLTPTAPPATYPATLTVPLNTEPLDATQEATLDQALLDGVENARLQLYGKCNRQTAAYNGTDITIQPLGAVTVLNGVAWKVLPHKVVSTYTPAGLVANTRYYLYAYNAAGAVAFVHSVDAPDAGHFYKTGDEQYLFVGTFHTITAGAIMRYVQDEHSYVFNQASIYNNRIVASGNAVVPTTTALGVCAPPGARTALMMGGLTSTGAGRAAFIRSTSDIYGLTLEDDGTNFSVKQCTVSLNGVDTITWAVTNAGSALDVWVYGFTY